jgi:hypothetical protein
MKSETTGVPAVIEPVADITIFLFVADLAFLLSPWA